MGWNPLKSVAKAVKKVGKGIVKGLKSVGKFVGSAVSKIAKSGLGKAIIIGAAVWATGGLLAAAYGAIPAGASAFSAASVKAGFGALGSSVGGALGVGGQAAASGAGAAATGANAGVGLSLGGGSIAGGAASLPGAGLSLGGTIGGTAGAGTIGGGGLLSAGGALGGGGLSLAPGAFTAAATAAPTASGGLLSSLVGGWKGASPITKYAAMQAAGNAFTALSQPTEEELLQAQINAEQERLRLARENFQLGTPMDYRVYTGNNGPYRSM